MSRSGVLTAIVTDHPVIPLQYLTLEAGLAVKEGMDYFEALKAITINPATILGLDDKIGSIKQGKDADLVIYDGDPLALATKVKFVAINGKRVK
jgi:imidazolonepropionase-like amidohydrolase